MSALVDNSRTAAVAKCEYKKEHLNRFDLLNDVRLRCLLVYDEINEIAKSIDFPLSNFLYDHTTA